MKELKFLDHKRDLETTIVIHELATALKEGGASYDEDLKKAMRRILKYYLTVAEYMEFKMWCKEK